MSFETYDCDRCGGSLTAIDGESYKCQYCGKIFHKQDAEEQTKTFRDMFDDIKREHINNLRRNLYDAVNAEYVSSFDVKMRCEELKKYLPDDFSACFYEVAAGNNVRQLTKYIRKIDVEKNYDEIECVVKFLIKSLQTEYQLELNNLIARAYERRDPEIFEKFCTMLSEEAVKVDNGVYETKLPREVFIAYSSKDMDKVSELCEFLESQGLKCFVAARNLRHGKGAVENYNKALEEAMDHSKCVVFVSSMNSRNFNCDALTIELPYIQQKDIDAAPAEYRNNYKGMPQEYKKPRVEYRIGESLSRNVADSISDEIFDGYERVYSPEEVAQRVMKQLVALNDRNSKKTVPETKIVYAETAEDPNQRIEQILNRAIKSMEEGEWSVADGACERALDIDTECAEAYVLKLMIDCRVTDREELANAPKALDGNVNFVKAVKYADEELGKALFRYDTTIKERIENKKRAAKKKAKKTVTVIACACIAVAIIAVIAVLSFKAVTYQIAMNKFESGDIEEALDAFELIPDYKNSNEMILFSKMSLGDVEYLRNYIIENSLGEIVIPNGVTSIGDNAFYGCDSLTSVVIPDSVTSIGNSAFYGCRILMSVEIPDSVTSIGSSAFSGCDSLTSVVIPDSVTSIGEYAFSECTNLTSVVIPDSVTSIGEYAFSECTNLTSVVIPDSVTSVGDSAFRDCTSLTSVYITDIAKWCAIDFGDYSANPLYCAHNLYLNGELVTELVIHDSVMSIGSYAFYECTSLTSVVIPDSVTNIGSSAFYECTSLTSVEIGDSVTSIGSSAFSDCYSLTSVVIPDSVTRIEDYAFYNCTSLTSVHITDIAKWCAIDFDGYYANPLYYAHNLYLNGELVTELVIPDSVTSIGSYAFYECTSLKSVEIGDSVTSIGNNAFSDCTSLTSVVIPDSVTSIGSYAFSWCTSLTSVVIPDSVTSIGSYAFYECTSLTSVTFKNPNGWWYASSSDATSGTSISSSDLADAGTADTCLKSTYSSYYWKRS